MSLSNDLPIEAPAEDRFGLDPFAAALAASISGMSAPSGAVVAVNGAWGSGKSSAVNLIKHHLKPSIDAGDLVVVPFNPWWFTGTDTLTLAFFQELNKAIGPSLPATVRKSLAALGQGISTVGALAGALANLKLPGLGEVISGATGLFGKLVKHERTVDEEHRLVSAALGKQSKRFLVIIDDIDRLSPDDALTIFRLVKSVGRLPNVIYLLAFDRQIAERIVSERFPSEGPSYLEKIVQGAFELPPPMPDLLRTQVLEAAVKVMGEPPEPYHVRFLNVFHDVVSPTIRTPRDAIRLGNHLATIWPAVADNVDRADLLAITALQLAEPKLYAAIREHGAALTGLSERGHEARDALAGRYDALLTLAERPERERERLRTALRRLFPRLDSVWGNMYYSDTSGWRRDRLIASTEHFRSYFSFSISEDAIPASQMRDLVARADDPAFVRDAFVQALAIRRRSGSTHAALLLEECQVYAREFDTAKVTPFVETLFAIADELDVAIDVLKGFNIGNNLLRMHWLLNILVHERFTQAEREAIYRPAMEGASLGWACDFTERCVGHFAPNESDRDRGEPIVSQEVAEAFRAISLAKLREAATDGSLIAHRDPTRLMFDWVRLGGEAVAEVRAWTDTQLANPAFVVALAKNIPSESYSHGMGFDGMGDRVARRAVRVNFKPYADILDVPGFEASVVALIEAGTLPELDLQALREFRDIPRGNHERGE